MPHHKVMLFDADGVVIEPAHRFMKYLMQELKVPPGSAGEFYGGPFRDCLIGKADLQEAIAPFLPKWGWSESVEEFLLCWFTVENNLNVALVELIQELRRRGYWCAIATNQEKYRLQFMTHEMQLTRLFDGFFGSADIGAVQPSTSFYREVTRRISVAPSEIFFWDDSQENVDSARNFGWRAERYTGLDQIKELVVRSRS